MLLREVYIRVETKIITQNTKNRIENLEINGPEYEKKYQAIMRDYELRIQELTSLSK